MLTLVIAIGATAISVALVRRGWPTGADGRPAPRRDVPREEQAQLLVFPVVCAFLGLITTGPAILAEGNARLVVAAMVAVVLGGVLAVQTAALRKSRAARS